MEDKDHENLEQWARNFGGTAILGFIATLLISGKFLHHIFQRRGLIFGILIIPPAMLSGLLGLFWFLVMEFLDPLISLDLRSGLEAIKYNLINFVFAALILGLTCSRTNSQHNTSWRGMITSLLHEGMPMIIYSQILMWGQSTCCLFALCLANLFSAKIPVYFAAMIPLGIEAGSDIMIATSHSKLWSEIVVEEAESLGMVAVCVTGIILFSLKPYFIAKGWLGPAYSRDSNSAIQQGTGQAEAFERSSTNIRPTLKIFMKEGNGAEEEVDAYTGDKDDISKSGHASLGAHLSFISLVVFLSFGLSLTLHLIEIELKIDYHFLSGVRMFKFAMCCAMLSMQILLHRFRVRFKREWFMRLCGLMLDLLVISALSKANPKPKNLEPTHYLLVGCFVMICLLWNLGCLVFTAQYLFPNYWFERGLTLTGDAMGHSYTGLLFARTLDPTLESPVPAAYAYKLMLFFIPSSGGKNTILLTLLEGHGAWAALLVSALIVATWIIIFDTHFKHRFVNTKIQRNGKGSSSETVDSELNPMEKDSDQEPLMNVLSFESEDEGKLPVSNSPLEGHSGGTLTTATRRSFVTSNLPSTASSLNLTEKGLLNLKVISSEPSSILSPEQMSVIAGWLSDSKACKNWNLRYSLRQHGASLSTLLQLSGASNPVKSNDQTPTKVSSANPCIIIIEDSWGYIFGGLICPWFMNKKTYYGNGESFVFSVAPASAVYRWTGQNSLFVLSNESCFAMGGGGDGFAIQLDDELDTGVSNKSATFSNATLSSSEFFKCLNVEVWGLDSFSGYI